MMRLLGKISSAILALIAIPLFTIAACNLAIKAAIFNRTTYDAVLEDDAIFEEMLAVALPLVLNAPGTEVNVEGADESPVRIQDVVRALEEKPQVWAQVANLLIPPDWLQGTSTQLVDVIFAMVAGDIDSIEQEVDLSELRARFRGEEASRAANLIIAEAPSCNDEQLEELRTVLSERVGVLPICNPDNDALAAQSINAIEAWFRFVASEFEGGIIPVSQMFDINRDEARAFSIGIDLIFNQALILFYLCPMAFLSLIVLMVVRSLGGFGRWIGSVSLAVGAFILIIIFALQAFAFGIISDAVSNSNTPAEQFLARFGSAMLRSALGESSASLLFQAALFIGLGFIFFALAWYFGRNQDEDGSVVFITEEGDIISTATQERVGSLAEAIEEDSQPPN